MKKGLLVLCSIGILSLSLVSCNGKESKINNKSAEDFMKTATEETMSNVETVVSGNFIGLAFTTSNDITAKIKVTADNGLNVSADMSVSQKEEIAANVNVAKLDNEDPEAIEFYMNSNQSSKTKATIKENSDSEATSNSADSSQLQEIGLKLGVYSEAITLKNNDNEYKNSDSMDLVEYGMYSQVTTQVKDVIDTLNGKGSEALPEIPGADLDMVDPEMISLTLAVIDGFLNGEVTSDELVSSLESVLGMELGDSLHDAAVSLVDLIHANNPADYVSYTQIKSKENVTIKASFDYNKWKKDFTKGLDGIVSKTNPELESYEFLQLVQYFAANLLPESLSVAYSFTTTSGIITKVTTDISASGSLSGEFIEVLESITGSSSDVPAGAKIAYEVTEATSAEWSLGNTPVTVKNVTVE